MPAQADVTLELRYNKLLNEVDGAGRTRRTSTRRYGLHFPDLENRPGRCLVQSRQQVGVSTPSLERVEGNLLNDVKTIAYPKLTEVGGYLAVTDNVSNDSGSCDFRSLHKVGGQLYFDSTNIYAAIDMPELEEVGTAAHPAYYKEGANDQYYKDAVYGSCALLSYDGLNFPKLRKVGGRGFTLDLGLGMANFTDLNLFALEEVEGIFQIHQNGPDMQSTAPLETIGLPVIQNRIGAYRRLRKTYGFQRVPARHRTAECRYVVRTRGLRIQPDLRGTRRRVMLETIWRTLPYPQVAGAVIQTFTNEETRPFDRFALCDGRIGSGAPVPAGFFPQRLVERQSVVRGSDP